MESNSLCNHTSDKQNWTNAERKSDLLITSMITGRIEQQEVLLPITHNRFNFRKQQIHLGVISPAEAMSKVKKIWKFLNSLLGEVAVAMVIVFNSMIGGFG